MQSGPKPLRLFAYAFFFMLCMLGAEPTRAAVIYDNGSPQLVPVPAQGALFADQGNGFFNAAADDFILPVGPGLIGDIHWWGTYGITPGADAFVINIYNDNAGTVGSLAAAVSVSSLTRTATTDTINGRTMYSYDAFITPIILTPLTTYWLGISNTSGGTGSSAWAWVQSANSGGNARQYSNSNGTWGNSTNKALAFNLTDTVPEPSTYALLLTGIAALTLVRSRRRRS